ncbi:MAG: hypothetical protein QM656_03380 [Paracoccaceae bacterium]
MSRILCLIGLHRWVWESWMICLPLYPDLQLCARCHRYRAPQGEGRDNG